MSDSETAVWPAGKGISLAWAKVVGERKRANGRLAAKKIKDLRVRAFSLVDQKTKIETKCQFERAEEKKGVKVLYLAAPSADVNLVRSDFEFLKTQGKDFVGLFRSDFEDKFNYIVFASPDLVRKGWDSNALVQKLNVELKGNGGGRPDFAVGGSKNMTLKEKVKEIYLAGSDGMLRSLQI